MNRLIGIAAFICLATLSHATLAQTGITERVSVDSAGIEANAFSFGTAINADGNIIAFSSDASNLVPGDSNGITDIFVHDRTTGVTERVSVKSDGGEANGISFHQAISGDGNIVVFNSRASNLDTSPLGGVFVHDRTTGVTERVSVDSDGNLRSGGQPAISTDGNVVTFVSNASDLVPGDTNSREDIFVHDRTTGVTERVSVDSFGTEANDGASFEPALSADGNIVTFTSFASNLVPGDTNGTWDVFVHDRTTGVTERVSVDSFGNEANEFSFTSSFSADGNVVTFYSIASNLVSGDTNLGEDIFVHDRTTGVTERVSVDSFGTEANGVSFEPTISADGNVVAFYSDATNLVPGDTNGEWDMFLHNRTTGVTERVSVDSAGNEANDGSFITAARNLNADGSVLAFHSFATNLVSGDTNNTNDIFVRLPDPGITEPGQDVEVTPIAVDENGDPIGDSPVTFTFDEVTDGGETAVTVTEMGPPPPGGLKLGNPPVYLDLETTATFVGSVEICIDYTSFAFGAENRLVLAHFTDPDGDGPLAEQWVDITTFLDTDANIICGTITLLSTFALVEPEDPVELLEGLADLIAELNARKGILNSLDAKYDAVVKAHGDANENNDSAAVNALQALINATEAQSGEQILPGEADELIASAGEIIAVLTGEFF